MKLLPLLIIGVGQLSLGSVEQISNDQNIDYHIDESISLQVAQNSISHDFEELELSIEDYYYTSMDWGDYDADGDLDLIISGALDSDADTYADSSVVDLYINDNGTLTKDENTNFYGLHLGAVKWFDIDLDGDLDLITTGQSYVDIVDLKLFVYKNDNGSFIQHQADTGFIYSSIDAGDYDLDGDEDIIISGGYIGSAGAVAKTVLFNNNNGLLEESTIQIPGIQNGDAQFIDADKDGNPELLLMGAQDDGSYILNHYNIESNTLTLKQSMGGMYLGCFSIADYDNDGDLDFAVMGDNTNDDLAAYIYANTGSEFVLIDTLKGVDNSSGYSPLDWSDLDLDGRRDLVMGGTDDDYNEIFVSYKNGVDSFEVMDLGIEQLGSNVSTQIVNLDNDNRPDIVIGGMYFNADFDFFGKVAVYKNTFITENNAPDAPENLMASFNSTGDSLSLSWDLATDDHTPSEGLYYWVKVIRMSDNQLIASYPVFNTHLTLNIPQESYSYSIQSIDASDVFSSPATSEIIIEPFNIIENYQVAIHVSPVPAKEFINLYINSEIDFVEISNISGQVIWSGKTNGKVLVSDFKPGYYTGKVYTKNKSVSFNFIKI